MGFALGSPAVTLARRQYFVCRPRPVFLTMWGPGEASRGDVGVRSGGE